MLANKEKSMEKSYHYAKIEALYFLAQKFMEVFPTHGTTAL